MFRAIQEGCREIIVRLLGNMDTSQSENQLLKSFIGLLNTCDSSVTGTAGLSSLLHVDRELFQKFEEHHRRKNKTISRTWCMMEDVSTLGIMENMWSRYVSSLATLGSFYSNPT